MSSYGYMPYYTPRRAGAQAGAAVGQGLAAAAASKDPYGLAPNNRSGPLGIGSSSGFAAPPRAAAPPKPAAAAPTISPLDPRIAASLAANPYAAGTGSLFAYQGPPSASDVNHYDLNTDAGLQQIQSLVGQSNEGAQAAALKQRQDLLLGYGDAGVAKSVLGADDPIAAAAGQNPTSTVAQLGQQRDRNLHDLDEQLNQANLGYSGYRVTQEQQAGQDYQNALAQAAAGLNSNLDTVNGNLAAVIAGNNSQLVSGINDAANRAAQAAASSGTDPGAFVTPLFDPATDPSNPANEALATAAGGGTQPPPAQNSGYSPDAGAASTVGTSQNDAIYRLLGRKMDPRYNF